MANEESSSKGSVKAFVFLALTASIGLAALHFTRPDLSPLDGRLFITVKFRRISDLKPSAPIKYGETQLGEVAAIQHDEDGKDIHVHIIVRPECKKYVNKSTVFRVQSALLGKPYLALTVSDLNAERLTHNAVVEGTDGLMGALEKFGDKVKKGLKDLEKDFENSKKGKK
jgi:ABC-type transporter Mla subunit MlaD